MRMLGLFMVVPVLGRYVQHFEAATPLLIGLALGVYGATQASLQIPFGRWSDRVGRKPVISVGLLVFMAGSLLCAVAANAASIWGVVVGRAIQGAGAVSGTTLALAADLTRATQRTKTMAVIGICIGAAFSVAGVVGPLLDAHFGLAGVFLASAGLGLAALVLLWACVPTPNAEHLDAGPTATPPELSGDRHELLRLQMGVLFLHMALTASFVSIPVVLSQELSLAANHDFKIYLPVLLLSVVALGPALSLARRPAWSGRVFAGAIVCVGLGELLLWLVPARVWPIGAALTLFFTGFNFLEASLPSQISRAAPAARKGAALGAYSTGQFIGMFVGGVSGGWIASHLGTRAVFAAVAVLCLCWWTLTVRRPATHPPVATARA